MPYATNRLDAVRTDFEDAGGAGLPVHFYTGFADPFEGAKASRLGRALSGEFRLIFADHRGQGGSDKPREASAYALATRVGDAVAVRDALGTSGRRRRRRATPLAPHEGRFACERGANTRTAYGSRRWVSQRGEGAWPFPAEPAG